MAYAFFDRIGFQPIADVSSVQRHPLGTRVHAYDPTYGEAEFVYLKGVAGTAVGSCVTYDPKNATTALTVAASKGPCAVAMSANVSGFGWYAVAGAVPVVSAAAAAAAIPYVTAVAGSLSNAVVAGQGITGAAQLAAPVGGLADTLLDHPSIGGL